ncbi:hypothetical protein ACLOJK_035031 [Asimina triloba]
MASTAQDWDNGTVGGKIYLKLQPLQLPSVGLGCTHKRSPWFYGPFPIVEQTGHVHVPYKLQLSSSSQGIDPSIVATELPAEDDDHQLHLILFPIMSRRATIGALRCSSTGLTLLPQRQHLGDIHKLWQAFPQLDLEDQLQLARRLPAVNSYEYLINRHEGDKEREQMISGQTYKEASSVSSKSKSQRKQQKPAGSSVTCFFCKFYFSCRGNFTPQKFCANAT